MKKTIVLLIAIFSINFTFAQNEKYTTMMEETIAKMDDAKSIEDLQNTANVFERISNAEKKEWLPSYYNALCNIHLAAKSMENGEVDMITGFSDKAQAALDHCLTLVPNESEVYALQGFIYTSRIWTDPMTAGAEFSPRAHEAFGKAIAMNPNNPRAFYLRAQLVFYTPEFWGGGPKNAYKDLVKAEDLFENFETATSIHPDWGKESNDYHLKKAKEVMEPKN